MVLGILMEIIKVSYETKYNCILVSVANFAYCLSKIQKVLQIV